MHTPISTKGRAALLVLLLLVAPMMSAASAQHTRSTTVWNGTVSLPDGYLVQSNQILVIQAGTTIKIGAGERIGVDGRLTVQGTASSPVSIEVDGAGDHEGIQFNSSSRGKNSVVDNLTISDAIFGITVYDSDPRLSNLTVVNADKVAVDMFSSASPVIRDLVIDGGGQDDHGSSTTWRYGIGLSIGDGSAPIVQGVTAEGLITRGINVWGNSGGLISDVSVSNISGATLAAAAGIWVEDSISLITDSHIVRSDNGIIVRHQSQDLVTRPTFMRTVVEDSQYRGIFVEQYNHSNYANLQTNAIFEDLELRGTGGAGAKTPGLGYVAFDVNTSGVRVTNGLIEDNTVVGFRAYTADSSTSLTNLTIRNNGPTSPTSMHEGAGILFRSTSWTTKGPVTVTNLLVENNSGSGVHMAKGGVIGTNWTSRDNGGSGVYFSEFHPLVDHVVSEGNAGHGMSVRDSGNVELSFISTSGNGIGSSEPEEGAGIYIHKSNYVMSGGKNVSCVECTSSGDQYGIVVRNSIDLQLISTTIVDSLSEPALDINNSATLFAGTVLIDDMMVSSASTSYSVFLESVDADIRGLDLSGDSGGMYWKAKGMTASHFSSSVLWENEAKCLDLVGHTDLIADNISLICDSTNPTIDSSLVNFTESSLTQGADATNSFVMNSTSHLRWINSEPLGTPGYNEMDSILDVMWDIDVHVINQNLLNIPHATVNITFDLYEEEYNATLPYSGHADYGPFVGMRWTPIQNWSETNNAYVGCNYDGVNNTSAPMVLDGTYRVYCRLELSNQPPFILWDMPEEEAEMSTGSEVLFDASRSWDLDFDGLTYSWESSIDGDLLSACGTLIGGNGSIFSANTVGEPECLSDGTHLITLEVCDTEAQCVNETRTITLVNRPPVLTVGTTPGISAWGTLYLGMTANVTIHLNGTYDPEGGSLWCWAAASFESWPDPDPENPYCPMEIVRSFPDAPEDEFTVSVVAFDGVNPAVSWTFSVELYNEIPTAVMEVTRNGDISSDWIRLDGMSTTDPEGDEVRFEFWSDIDGVLASGYTPDDDVEWIGTLSKGSHTITMKASDIRSEHGGMWNTAEQQIVVLNSPPSALISNPLSEYSTDSSELLLLDATGSGDWDLSCADLPDNGSGLLCNPTAQSSTNLVSVLWESDILEEPIGGDWRVHSRLPVGEHIISLTLDDGSGAVTDQVSVNVEQSAPVLILDSPESDIEVYSNLPVLFDFRKSVDYDGDDFTVTVSSDLMGTILEDKSTDYWYNDYLMAGTHTLTFVLTDSNGLQRTHTQGITVLETGPVAVITGLDNWQYVPPGQEVVLSAADSFDYDNDIILYEWTLHTGEVLSDRQNVSLSLPPGTARVNLLVKDSRGSESFASINMTIGSSAPQLHDLTVSVPRFEAEVPTEILITVRLEDPDGTTDTVRGEITSGGLSEALYFRDDGTAGDAEAGDGIWTHSSIKIVNDDSWARIEVWAIDADLVSQGMVRTVPIVQPDGGGISSWVLGIGLPFVGISMVVLGLAGLGYQKRKMQEIAKDMEIIESWSSFDPRELDEEFDADED